MEPLTGAASCFAVMSVAMQLRDNLTKIRDFWQSVRDAPKDIRVILRDLQELSSVLAGIAFSGQQQQHVDNNTRTALETCTNKVKEFQDVVDVFNTGFASDNRMVRKWSAFKVARKAERLRDFKASLEETKSTLMMAQLGQLASLPNLLQTFCVRQDELLALSKDLSRSMSTMQMQQSSRECTTIHTLSDIQTSVTAIKSDLDGTMRARVSSIASARMGSELNRRVQELADDTGPEELTAPSESLNCNEQDSVQTRSYSRSTSGTNPIDSNPSMEIGKIVEEGAGGTYNNTDHVRRRQRLNVPRLTSCNTTTTMNALGEIVRMSRTLRTLVAVGNDVVPRDETIISFRFHPAPWLLRWGLTRTLEVATAYAKGGWKYTIQPMRTVPNDALIFQFCKKGNVDAVQTLMERGDASVFDVHCNGATPLHIAMCFRQLDLARYLISQGADKLACTYLGKTPLHHLDEFHTVGETREVLRLFDDDLDFDGSGSSGWSTIPYLGVASENFLAWVIRNYHSEMVANIDEVRLWRAATVAIERESQVDLLAILGLHPAVVNLIPEGEAGLLQESIWGCESPTMLRMLLEKGADMHLVTAFGSPTSYAMSFSSWFRRWFSCLADLEPPLDLDSFVETELALPNLPLFLKGWEQESLRELFSRFRELPMPKGSWSHENCKRCGDFGPDVVEPWWEEQLCRLRAGKCCCPGLEPVRILAECFESSPTLVLGEDEDSRDKKSKDEESKDENSGDEEARGEDAGGEAAKHEEAADQAFPTAGSPTQSSNRRYSQLRYSDAGDRQAQARALERINVDSQIGDSGPREARHELEDAQEASKNQARVEQVSKCESGSSRNETTETQHAYADICQTGADNDQNPTSGSTVPESGWDLATKNHRCQSPFQGATSVKSIDYKTRKLSYNRLLEAMSKEQSKTVKTDSEFPTTREEGVPEEILVHLRVRWLLGKLGYKWRHRYLRHESLCWGCLLRLENVVVQDESGRNIDEEVEESDEGDADKGKAEEDTSETPPMPGAFPL